MDDEYVEQKRSEIGASLDLSRTELEREADQLRRRRNTLDPDAFEDRYALRVLDTSIADVEAELLRVRGEYSLFNKLLEDVCEAARINDIVEERRQRKRQRREYYHNPGRKTKKQRFLADTILRDAVLYHDGSALHSTRHTLLSDTCSCGAFMERNVYQSYLVCPDCKHMRWFVDTSMAATGNRHKRHDTVRHPPKCQMHFGNYVNMCQGKSAKIPFPKEYEDRMSRELYVYSGVRDRRQITKEMIHAAQSALSPKGRPDYTSSMLLLVIFRGNVLRFPPQLERYTMYLFSQFWPKFVMYKRILEMSRTNLSAFKFIMRLFLKYLGHDVYLPCIEGFKMRESRVKHAFFARMLCRVLGLVWEDRRIVDISDEDLDWYEAEQGFTDLNTELTAAYPVEGGHSVVD